MNRPIFRVVNPWFLILLSFERKLTISAAQHPGESPTYSMISSFNRFNLAAFCEPFPLILINTYCVTDSILIKQGYTEGSRIINIEILRKITKISDAMSLASNDPLVGYIKWISAIVIVVLPWIFLHLKMRRGLRNVLGIAWMMSILSLTALYLGFLTYHYMGWQLGFNHQGNPMDWFMIITGILGAIPFLKVAKNGTLEKPIATAILVGVAMLIVMGPAIYNSVALNVYLQGDGEFGGGQGEYSGEEYDPTEPVAWAQAGIVGLFACNLVPTIIFIGIWQLSRLADPIQISKAGD